MAQDNAQFRIKKHLINILTPHADGKSTLASVSKWNSGKVNSNPKIKFQMLQKYWHNTYFLSKNINGELFRNMGQHKLKHFAKLHKARFRFLMEYDSLKNSVLITFSHVITIFLCWQRAFEEEISPPPIMSQLSWRQKS